MIMGRKACFLVCLVFSVILLLVSCAGGIPQGTTDTLSDEANKLIGELSTAIENTSSLDIPDPGSSPTEYNEWAEGFLNAASSMIYIPTDDFDQLVGEEELQYLFWAFRFSFFLPATVTSIEVEGITEYPDTKYLPFILSDKPDFVQKTYFLSLRCTTQDGTETSVHWPMIEVGEDYYFFSIDIVDTGSGTEVRIYPEVIFPL